MASPPSHDLPTIVGQFRLPGELVTVSPYGSGHINDTFAVTMRTAEGPRRFVLQRINHHVFRQPDQLMENVERVCAHSQRKLGEAGVPDAHRRALRLLPTRDGRAWHVDRDGNRWRCYDFIEQATDEIFAGE